MVKLHELKNKQIVILTSLEAELEKYITSVKNIPRIDVDRASELIASKTEAIKQRAGEVTGFPMKALITVRSLDYVIVDLYPADEEPPKKAVRLLSLSHT